MVFLYYKIFKAIHDRAKKSIGSRKTYSTTTSEAGKMPLVIENTAQTRKLQQEEVSQCELQANVVSKVKRLPLITETDALTNMGSGSQADEEEDDKEESPPEIVECHIVKNERTQETEYILSVNRSRGEVAHKRTKDSSPSPLEVEITVGLNGNTNTDSGYAASHIEDIQFCVQNPNTESPTNRPPSIESAKSGSAIMPNVNKNGSATKVSASSSHDDSLHSGHNHYHHQKHHDSVSHSGSTTASTGAGCNAHVRQAKKKSRFNLGRKHKSSRKKREKASAKRERKATKTLAIVLGECLVLPLGRVCFAITCTT